MRQEIASPATADRAADTAKLRLKMQPGKTQPTFQLHACQEEHPPARNIPLLLHSLPAHSFVSIARHRLKKSWQVCERNIHTPQTAQARHARWPAKSRALWGLTRGRTCAQCWERQPHTPATNKQLVQDQPDPSSTAAKLTCTHSHGECVGWHVQLANSPVNNRSKHGKAAVRHDGHPSVHAAVGGLLAHMPRKPRSQPGPAQGHSQQRGRALLDNLQTSLLRHTKRCESCRHTEHSDRCTNLH